MLTCLEWGRVDCLELERNKRSERSMIDGQGVVSHQRDRRSMGCSGPDAGQLISALLDAYRCWPSAQTTNAHTKPQPRPEIQGARDRQQRTRELVVPLRPVVPGPAWGGQDRLCSGGRRAGAQGAHRLLIAATCLPPTRNNPPASPAYILSATHRVSGTRAPASFLGRAGLRANVLVAGHRWPARSPMLPTSQALDC
jgi:hypothetical protein